MTDNRNDGFDPIHARANGYTRQDWDEVSDNPEWTEEDFARAKPFAEVFPELAASIGRDSGASDPDAEQEEVTLHLDADVIAKFKATGANWQARINDVLRAAKP